MFSINTFCAELQPLKIEDVSKSIDNSITLKKFDIGYNKLSIVYDNLSNQMKALLDMNMQRNFLKLLDFVFTPDDKPRTIYYLLNGTSIPVYMNHTLDKYEKEAIMDLLHIPKKDEDRLKLQNTIELTKELQPERVLSQLNLLNKNREAVRSRLELTGKQLYNALILSEEGIKLQNSVVATNKLQLDFAEQRFNEGVISQNDFDTVKLSYEQSLLTLNSRTRSRDNLIMSLNKLMSVPLDTKYSNIEGEITCTSFEELDISTQIKKALDNRYEMYSANEALRLKTLEFDIISKNFVNDSYKQYREALFAKQQEERKASKVKEDITAEITKAVSTIEENYQKLKVAENSYNSANLSYETMKQRYDNGLITQDILNLAQLQAYGTKISLLGAINTYNMSQEKLKYATGVGPGF